MTETLGTARLDIVVDTSQFDNAIAAAKSRVSGMSQTAQAEYEKLNAAEKRRVNSLITQADLIGKTREEQILYNAALKGAPTAVLEDLKRRLQGVNQATKDGTISAKQYNAALRGVPAQLTDIFTSLQGGQNPLTVLFQQGGQLRDMFGGIGPAASALGGALAGLVNPATIAAAAVAGLGLALLESENRSEAFNTALVKTGNELGTTAEGLRAMAEAIGEIDGVTLGTADEALLRVASGGRIAADQLQKVSESAALWATATGQSVDSIVDKFEDLAKDPLDAILKLNEAENFLTQAQLDRISTLKEEGREQEAARVAIDAYADTLNRRAPEVIEGLGNIKSLWIDIKDGASDAAAFVMDFADTAVGAYRRAMEAQVTFAARYAAIATSGSGGPLDRIRALADAAGGLISGDRGSFVKKGPAGLPGIGAPTVDSAAARKELKEQEEASKRFAAVELENLSKREKLEQKILEIKADGLKAGKDQATIEAQVTAERRKFAEAEEKANRKRTPRERRETDPTENIVARIKQQISLNEAEAASEEKLTGAERLRIQVLQELDRIGGKATAARRAEIAGLLEQAIASEKAATAVENQRKAKEALLALDSRLKAASESRAAENRAALAQFGMGDREIEQLRRRAEILREFEEGVADVQRNRANKTADELAAESAAWEKWRDDELKNEGNFWRAIDAERSDALNGVRRAMANYVDEAGDIAGQTEAIFRNAFGGLEDVFVEFFTKGKADWRGFLDSIAADITRFIVRQQIAKLAQKFLPGLGGGGDDQASALAGSAAQLTASGGVLLSAAGALSASAAALAAAGAASGGAAALGGAAGGWNPSGGGGLFGSILSWFTSGGLNANGNAFLGGNVIPFANGGLVTSPTSFPMSGGRRGLMGEAGPEAIVPLKRGPDGKLGVRMEGSGGGQFSQVVNVRVDGRPDRRTTDQVAMKIGRESARAMSRNR
jgi:lambda family phage tail tape measure protein